MNKYENWLDFINLYHYYPNPYFWGGLLFFLVPVVIWLIGTLFIKRQKTSDKLLAFIAGSDNRLSLSRLQAFAWTLVIFGSFVAAMAIHTKITPLLETDLNRAKNDAQLLSDMKDYYKTSYDEAIAAFKQSGDKTKLDAAKDSYYKAVQEADTAAANASDSGWVRIPPALLLLAGIAIASGIFSSLISAINDEEKTACVNGIEHLTPDVFNNSGNYPNTIKSESPNLLRILGIDMGKVGKVRFGKSKVYSAYAPVLFWKSDGTEIIVDVPPEEHPYTTIIVDTPNGKLPYAITYEAEPKSVSNMKLGIGQYWYEFSDLFRDDKNPMNMDLMKFQMFGWTIVAIVIYSWLFLNDLRGDIKSLPLVPESIVLLTGLSQAGYLAGKGVSNIKPNQSAS